MPARLPAVAGTLLLALAAPAVAQAGPTIEPLRPCYIAAMTPEGPQTEGVEVRAAGFTPNSRVNLTRDGVPLTGSMGLQVDDDGQLLLDGTYAVPAPFVNRGQRDFTIALTEQDNPANTVSATAKVAKLQVKIRPKKARASQRIRFEGTGFTAEKPVYAHYIRRNEQVARVRMARRTGECGAWSARRPQFPMREPEPGIWIVQFDQSKKYRDGRRHKLVHIRVRYDVSLVPG